jgi:lipopolysaccharide transport system ATP-binding protein
MNAIVIKAEDVSKYYRLGKVSSGRLREDVSNWLRPKSTIENTDEANNSKH